jgi:hypothetical protein
MDLRQVTNHYYISVGHRMSTVICLQILTIFWICAFFPPPPPAAATAAAAVTTAAAAAAAAAVTAASSQKGVRIGV